MTDFVRERFPQREFEIRRLYAGAPEFRSLCHDYGVCIEQIEKLEKLPASQANRQRLEQFRELHDELELEITEYLNTQAKYSPGQ